MANEDVIALQILNLILISTAIGLISILLSIKRYRNLWLWSIPIIVLLFHSFAFRFVQLIDALNGDTNRILYGYWSIIVHAQDKMTIVIYAIAFLAINWKRNIRESSILSRVFRKEKL